MDTFFINICMLYLQPSTTKYLISQLTIMDPVCIESLYKLSSGVNG